MYYTYVLYSDKYDRLYIGQTDSLEIRINNHNQGLVRSTKYYCPWELIHFEVYNTRSEAMNRERELKSHQGRDFIRNKILNGRVRQLPD